MINKDLWRLRMRATCEILADLKDGKEVPYEELRMALLALDGLVFLFKQDTKHLLKGGIGADMVKRMNYSDTKTSSMELGTPSWYWNAIKKDPIEWLGPKNIPGTHEYDKHYKLSKSLLDKFLDTGKNKKPEN